MAKYGVTNVAGGGGIGSDELSVTKDYVLNGKTYVGTDTNDEIGTGTMANNGTTANQSLNASGSFQVKKGYHAQDFSVNANSLASQTSATATSGHILSGQSAWVNGAKVNGSIPWQNADVSGTDRVRATNMSNWAGTINLGVRNGHYLNGVNWIQQDIPNFQPGNIKKGVNIGGVIGTFEGYVPTPTDLYLRGNNIAGWAPVDTNFPIFDAGQITLSKYRKYMQAQFNLTGFTHLNFEGHMTSEVGVKKEISLIRDHNSMETLILMDLSSRGPGNYLISLDILNFQINSRFIIGVVGMADAIYRIWLS